jgi:hypothetical protein
VLFALVILGCLLALLLMPGATTAVVVRTHASGKQYVRAFSVLTMIILAAGYSGLLHSPSSTNLMFRRAYLHRIGPDVVDITCARLC